jgi:Leucine-rich repeat (LRR) protein
MDYNGFYGTIPWFLGNLVQLEYITMNYNYLTGQIPENLSNLKKLQNLYFHSNNLDGTIPPELGNIGTLKLLELHGNAITGTIPAALSSLSALIELNLYINFLTGTVPPELGQLSALQTMDISDNYLTGTFPSELGNLTKVATFKVHACYLQGTIPETIGNMTVLSYLSLHSNHFTSTIPASLKYLQYLNALFVSSNMLTGTIAGFVNSTTQLRLAIVQVSGNALTGQIPDDLFALPGLETVVLGDNCFHGTLPAAMCDAANLKTLSLDGLQSGTTCRDRVFPGISQVYVLLSLITDGIPACLFQMESLNTLHLSGNGLTGSLPDLSAISSNIVDISLSHNSLTGTIPSVFQERIWYNFDLSYNKFKGTLTDNFATVPGNLTVLRRLGLQVINASLDEYRITSAALSLRNNRLSHTIPAVIQRMVNVSVLDGNLYGCALDKSDLPANDNGLSTYSCGSTSFDAAYFVFIGALLAAAVLAAVLLYYGRTHEMPCIDIAGALLMMKKWIQFSDMTHAGKSSREMSCLPRYEYVVMLLNEICKVAAWCTLYIVMVMLPVYGTASRFYGTHTYEYAWSVSAAFLSGADMAGIQLVCIFILLLGVMYLFWRLYHAMEKFLVRRAQDFYCSKAESLQGSAEEISAAPRGIFRNAILVYSAFFLANVAVVGTMNVLYLYAVIYGNSSFQTLAQLALSVFKLAWCRWNTYIVRWMQLYLGRSSTRRWELLDPGFFAVQLFVQLFNNIVVPCLVVASISADCFNSALVAAPDVTSHFYYDTCEVYTVLYACLIPVVRVASTSYSPPFNYSYQCSSSFITYYAPPFVIMCIIYTIVVPLGQLLLCWVLGRATLGTPWYWMLRFIVPRIFRPIPRESSPQSEARWVPRAPHFDTRQHLIILLTYLTLLLTFGAVFPPLAVCFAITMASIVLFAKLKVGRFLSNANEMGLAWCADTLEEECNGVGGTVHLRRAVGMIIAVSGLFYTFFLFDTLGDAVGFAGAYWVLIVAPSLTVCGVLSVLYYPLKINNRAELRPPVSSNMELLTLSPLSAHRKV